MHYTSLHEARKVVCYTDYHIPHLTNYLEQNTMFLCTLFDYDSIYSERHYILDIIFFWLTKIDINYNYCN